MKKTKRILALTGVVLLVCLYISTLILALIGSPLAINLLKSAVASTIILPLLLYGYMLLYRLIKKNSENEDTGNISSNSKQ